MKNDTKYIIATLSVLGNKYRLPIISCLFNGVNRFSAISKEVSITSKQLSTELKSLQKSNLIIKKTYNTTPVTIQYELTKQGKSLENIILELSNWGKNIK